MDDLISRQAAIDEIKALYEYHDIVTADRAIDHFKRLPSAQPGLCEDTVSRQRLLSDFKELVAAWNKYPEMAEHIKGVEAAIEHVEAIPSVTSQPKTGHWVRQTDDYYDYYECEHCGIGVGLDDIKNYCPNCGARMIEPQESEEE